MMGTTDWIPGIGHWRRGERRKGLILLLLFAMLAGIAWWRHEIMWASLKHVGHRLAGQTVPYMDRSIDFFISTLFVIIGIAALTVFSHRAAVRLSKETAARISPRTPWRIVWRRFKANRLALMGFGLVLLLYVVAILCPLLASHHPNHSVTPGDILAGVSLPPSFAFPLGTDRQSCDVLSRVLYGSRISLGVGLLAVAIAVTIGTIYGAVAGFFGGRIDSILMRGADMLLAVPGIVLIITITGLWDTRSIWIIIVIIGLLSWMSVARLVRGQFLSLKKREFYLAARALGAGRMRLMFVHLLPNALTPVIVSATLRVGHTILLEAGLSYLGLGVQPPHPSWGNIIFDNKGSILTHWWIPFSAGLAIVLTVVGYNLLGDGLRDALDPRLKK